MNLTRLYLAFFFVFATSVVARDVKPAVDHLVEKNVMVAMRDGVRLATDIYRPAKDGTVSVEKLPVILSRLPYNKDGQATAGKYYATHGYVFVAQDTRGRYASEGVWHMLTDDGRTVRIASTGSQISLGRMAKSA